MGRAIGGRVRQLPAGTVGMETAGARVSMPLPSGTAGQPFALINGVSPTKASVYDAILQVPIPGQTAFQAGELIWAWLPMADVPGIQYPALTAQHPYLILAQNGQMPAIPFGGGAFQTRKLFIVFWGFVIGGGHCAPRGGTLLTTY